MIIFYNKKTGKIHGVTGGRVHTKEELNSSIKPSGVSEEDIGKIVYGIEQTKKIEKMLKPLLHHKFVIENDKIKGIEEAEQEESQKPNSVDTILIDLTKSEDDIFNSFSKTTRQQIKKAENSKLTFREIGFNERELALQVLTTLEEQKDIRLAKHFLNIRSAFLDGLRRAYIVENDGEPVSAAIITSFGGRFVYSLAGTTEQGKKLHASDFMVWNLIKDAKYLGVFYIFDLGGVYEDWVEEKKLKVNEFKKRWGGRRVNAKESLGNLQVK